MRKKETDINKLVEEIRYRKKAKTLEFANPITEINVTPLVDICLVLVIIFLTFAPLIYLTGITITRARAAKVAVEAAATELKCDLYLKWDGTIDLNGKVVEEDALPDLMQKLLLRSLNRTVTISADPMVKHDRVVWALDLAKDKGAVTLCIMKRKTADTTATKI
ncbi:MAG: biopolymer transporter ExbD [Candidatus Stahlbacteria bacterium]|nr:biopolymer transporter ExbD [Candidatus Stahlbacteria bacterium]